MREEAVADCPKKSGDSDANEEEVDKYHMQDGLDDFEEGVVCVDCAPEESGHCRLTSQYEVPSTTCVSHAYPQDSRTEAEQEQGHPAPMYSSFVCDSRHCGICVRNYTQSSSRNCS